MFDNSEGLALYRTLEFPNETERSWPLAHSEEADLLIPYSDYLRDPRRDVEIAKKIAA